MRHGADDQASGWRRITNLLEDEKAARVILVLILGALGSLPLVILTPPFQVPDEMQHFYRAYQLSEFHLRAEVQNGAAGGTLPASLPQLVKASVYTRDEMFYPATPSPIAKTLQLRSIPLDPSARQFVRFPGSAFYSPLPYLPQIFGIVVGRAMGAGPLTLLFLGRLFNCLAALALLGVAVSTMPFAEELILLTGLLPMSLYLDASYSPDAAVIGCALVFSALSIAANARGNWQTRELWMAIAAAAVFCSVKPVYAPLLLVAVIPGVFRAGETARVIRSHLILLGAVLGLTAGWLFFAKSAMTSPLSGANPPAQIHFILHHPLAFAGVLARMVNIGTVVAFYVQSVGEYGWMTVLLHPGIVYVLPITSFLLLWRFGIRGSSDRSRWQGAWYLALVVASAVLVIVAVYLAWAHVGQDKVLGIQGRYFIPLYPVAGLAALELFPSRRPSAPRWRSLGALAVIVAIEIAAMDTTIIRAFHVF